MLVQRTTEFVSPTVRSVASPDDAPSASGCESTAQYALHVTDFYCRKAMSELRAIGACGRKADRRLADGEFDYNQESMRNGDGSLY